MQHSFGLVPGQLVSITQYHRDKLGPPLAVGHMAVSSETLRRADEEDTKGKAVHVLHTWKDSLWDLGPSKKAEVPEPRDLPPPLAEPASSGEAPDHEAVAAKQTSSAIESAEAQQSPDDLDAAESREDNSVANAEQTGAQEHAQPGLTPEGQ